MEIITLAQLLASLATVVTIIFLILQQNKQNLSVSNQIYQNFVENSLEIDRMLIAAPQYRKYIYGDAPIENLSEEERDQLMCMTELIADVLDNYDVFCNTIPKSKKKAWENFVETVKGSSAWKEFMDRSCEWYYADEGEANRVSALT